MIANRPGLPGAEARARALLALPVTRGQYEGGAGHVELVAPDGWTLDQNFLDHPDRQDAQVALALDYHTNVALYPTWQRWLRDHRPPTLVVWGRNDAFFTEAGAHAYRDDLPDAEVHTFDTGHFALDALDILRRAATPVEWSYVSPPPMHLLPGDKTGTYRAEATDEPIIGDDGQSRIIVGDFAAAVVDALEDGSFVRQRFTAVNWEDQATWAPALQAGAGAAYISFSPDLAIPGARPGR